LKLTQTQTVVGKLFSLYVLSWKSRKFKIFSFLIHVEGIHIELDYSKLKGKYKIKAIYQKQYIWSYDYWRTSTVYIENDRSCVIGNDNCLGCIDLFEKQLMFAIAYSKAEYFTEYFVTKIKFWTNS